MYLVKIGEYVKMWKCVCIILCLYAWWL